MDINHKLALQFLLVLLVGYWCFLILAPFVSYILLGLLLAFLCYPVYKWLSTKTGSTWGAAATLIGVLLLVILPSIMLASMLVVQAGNAYQLAQEHGVSLNPATINRLLPGVDASEIVVSLLQEGRTWLAHSIPAIISRSGLLIIGIVIALFVMYYALKEGPKWFLHLGAAIPMHRKSRMRLEHDLELATKALFFGQVLTSILIGLLCGIVFWIFGISNAVFWGFLMIILSFLPIVGAPVVYLPAGIILILTGHWVAGIAIIVLCSAVILIVDNIIRPKIVSTAARIHPLTVIVGALGGVYLMGFMGFIVGPLVLNIFLTLLVFIGEDDN